MNVTIVSDYGSGTDTEVKRFWYDEVDTLVVKYEDESELRYPHGEVVAAAQDDKNPDPREA
jgi:hypothetical protein